jgi:type II secretory pathway pseudopilin PulG
MASIASRRFCAISLLGFTLVEVTVVLVLLVLAAALVAPAFIFREEDNASSLGSIVTGVQELAARRGETLQLQVAADGRWKVESAASVAEGDLARGHLEVEIEGAPFTLVVSPIGTCGFDVRSSHAARFIKVDPLTCEVDAP